MSPAYSSPWWLPGGNLQTIWPSLVTPEPRVSYRRERWETPDGDFIDLDWLPWIEGAPLLVLFHGLEGSSQSHYARAMMHAAQKRGWNGCVPHFRGCSGELNLLPRAYHSGDSAEIDWVLRRMMDQHKPARLYAAGVSLGGNALLKWAGEQGEAAHQVVRAVASISAPLDLAAAGHALGRGFNKLYTRMFLGSLIKKSLEKLAQHPGLFDPVKVRAARDLYEFDNLVTAPLHGFRDTDHYWSSASAKPWLAQIRVPALALNARNDPFLPAQALPTPAEVSSAVTLEYPVHGGHVGFATGALPPGSLAWLPQRLFNFFEHNP
ncbi:MAG: putative hydrolase of the alpha/beta-hydrolase fold protein [Betaproteobacteria bacterium]|nr:putative hydrolase of the alpha/beta-hydrolase fold protein [Betaproteobacteria bacterium]